MTSLIDVQFFSFGVILEWGVLGWVWFRLLCYSSTCMYRVVGSMAASIELCTKSEAMYVTETIS